MGAVNTHLRTPQETVQKIGETEGKVPESLSADLGIADLEITEGGRAIRYVGKGEQTDVGERVEGVTQGLSIPSKGINRPGMRAVYPAHSISRTAMSDEAPPRKGRQEDVLAEAAVQGVNRPKIAEDTGKMAEDDGLGPFFDERKSYWAQLEGAAPMKQQAVNRPKMSRRAPRRTRKSDSSPWTSIGGVKR